MADMDKAAIVFSIAIALVGVGVAVAGSYAADNPSEDSTSRASVPMAEIETMKPDSQSEPFVDIANKAKTDGEMMGEPTTMGKDPMVMEDDDPMMMGEPTTMGKDPMVMEDDDPMMMGEPTTMGKDPMVMEDDDPMMMGEPTTMGKDPMVMEDDDPMMMGEPTTHIVDIPAGTSVPGCEESNACYLPADIEINAGDIVEWINVDTAAHTVTAGSPSNGPSGVFDSSLVMANVSYQFTFDETGSYEYFCMVHPWMTGTVTVN